MRQAAQSDESANLDDATPVGALRALHAAFRAGDEAMIRNLTRAKTPEQKRALAAKIPAWAQVTPFLDALTARFERSQVNELFMELGMMFATERVDPGKAKLEVHCDTAVLSGPSLRQKLIREDGHWKVYFDGWSEETTGMLLAYGEPYAEALRQTTPEVRGGRYKTAKEVNQAFVKRFEAAKRRKDEREGKLDDTTPEGATRVFEAAFQAGDEARLRNLTRAKTPEQMRALEARVRLWARFMPFVKAYAARFEWRGLGDQIAGAGKMLRLERPNPDGAKIEIDGDAAVLSNRGYRQKMIREDGHWKVYFDDWDEATVAALIANGDPLAEALGRTTPEIRAGKYKTAREVDQALMKRFEAIKRQCEDEKAKREGGEEGRAKAPD